MPDLRHIHGLEHRQTPWRHKRVNAAVLMLMMVIAAMIAVPAQAELPTSLTDKIYKGSGDINLLTDVLAGELDSYLQDGTMYLGIDLNESASAPESSSSVGAAIKDITLSIETTMGTYSFSDFYTNTTAMIVEAGETVADEFYTLFGTAGGNQITGSSTDYDLATLENFDDVIQIQNIVYEGEILTASLSVTFLDTEGTGTNEAFFDYSAGFEEFAILTDSDAQLLDSGNFGVNEATPTDVSFVMTTPLGSPEPQTFLVLLAGLWLVFKGQQRARK